MTPRNFDQSVFFHLLDNSFLNLQLSWEIPLAFYRIPVLSGFSASNFTSYSSEDHRTVVAEFYISFFLQLSDMFLTSYF